MLHVAFGAAAGSAFFCIRHSTVFFCMKPRLIMGRLRHMGPFAAAGGAGSKMLAVAASLPSERVEPF